MVNRADRERMIIGQLSVRGYKILHDSMKTYTAQQVKDIFTYLTDVPRVTAIGRTLEHVDTARILGVTMRDDNRPWKAMQFDAIDGFNNGGINAPLARCGLPPLPNDTSNMPEDEVVRISAVLHAEDMIYTHINYRKDKSPETFAACIDLIQRRPSDTARIIAIARTRQSIDAGLLENILDNAASALAIGVL